MLLVLAGGAGGYAYVQKLQKDNAILKTNQVKLETAVSENNKVIEQQTKDLKQIRSTLSNLEEEKKKLQADKDNLSKKLGKHDIGELAEKKPGLVEKIINKDLHLDSKAEKGRRLQEMIDKAQTERIKENEQHIKELKNGRKK